MWTLVFVGATTECHCSFDFIFKLYITVLDLPNIIVVLIFIFLDDPTLYFLNKVLLKYMHPCL